jgi:sulfate adenylyltransferase subunit 2
MGNDLWLRSGMNLRAIEINREILSLLRCDTTWRFRGLIAFCHPLAEQPGLALVVHLNGEGDVMKTRALKQAIDKPSFDFASGGTRRAQKQGRHPDLRASGPGHQPRDVHMEKSSAKDTSDGSRV